MNQKKAKKLRKWMRSLDLDWKERYYAWRQHSWQLLPSSGRAMYQDWKRAGFYGVSS